jgi:DUF971 family protein
MSAAPGLLYQYPFPESIVNHEASSVLALSWQDGSESRLPAAVSAAGQPS